MNKFIYATFTRSGVSAPIAQNVYCQLDAINDEEAVDHTQVAADYFRLITFPGYVPAIQQGDVMTDEYNVDPLTNALTVYRVRGQVESFLNHVEAKIDHKRVK